jgi:Sortase domain
MPAITSQPDPRGWDVDADWWGPAWDVVTPVAEAESARPGEAASGLADRDVPVSTTSYVAETDPSWVQILATTVGLWVLRRWPGAGLAWRRAAAELAWLRWPAAQPRRPPADVPSSPAGGPRSPAGLSSSPARRPRVAGRASAVWAAHARLLSAAMLGAGVVAAGAGTAGLVVAHVSAAPAVRLAAIPSPVAVPSGRTVVPGSLSTVQTPKPVWLTIPAIGVKAPIVTLGLNRNGTLQVPSSTTAVGWYTGSPRPGAIGSAVIAGHVDSRSGPGVFFWLRSLHRGERIYVRRADGTLVVFTVTAVRMYAKAQFPTATVYGPVPDAELRLITCGGTFDYARGSYLSNVVVYARLGG